MTRTEWQNRRRLWRNRKAGTMQLNNTTFHWNAVESISPIRFRAWNWEGIQSIDVEFNIRLKSGMQLTASDNLTPLYRTEKKLFRTKKVFVTKKVEYFKKIDGRFVDVNLQKLHELRNDMIELFEMYGGEK